MSNDNKQAKMKEGVYKSFSQVVLILAKFPADFELVHSFFQFCNVFNKTENS